MIMTILWLNTLKSLSALYRLNLDLQKKTYGHLPNLSIIDSTKTMFPKILLGLF